MGDVAGHGDAEVDQVGGSVRPEQHVRRLHVAVDHALAVGGGEGVEQPVGDDRHLVGGQRARQRDPIVQ